jgi:restriction system protein
MGAIRAKMAQEMDVERASFGNDIAIEVVFTLALIVPFADGELRRRRAELRTTNDGFFLRWISRSFGENRHLHSVDSLESEEHYFFHMLGGVIMSTKNMPSARALIIPTLKALHLKDGTGSISEIHDEVVAILQLHEEIVDAPREGTGMSELNYRLAWARTKLKQLGLITNSARGTWSLTDFRVDFDSLSISEIERVARQRFITTEPTSGLVPTDGSIEDSSIPSPEVIDSEDTEPWRKKLYTILTRMEPHIFERLAQRLLRECGFTNVEVTGRSGDGGIDGTGTLRVNGILSFSIAFQCKRYKDSNPVGPGAVRDFRGSLTTDIEKGLFITTSTFTKQAVKEAQAQGKQQIDLMDGEELINRLVEYRIGVVEITAYTVDESFFAKI